MWFRYPPACPTNSGRRFSVAVTRERRPHAGDFAKAKGRRRTFQSRSRGVDPMCLSCGCGEPEKRHGADSITLQDVQRAAREAEISPQEAAKNIQDGIAKAS